MKDGIGDRGGWLVGIDIGGTFTDVVAIQPDDAEVRAAKVPSQRDTPVAAIAAGLEAVGIDPADIDNLVHGTTRVTNAIVEEKLPPVALVSTEGFEDTLAIARLRRRDLYRLDIPPRRAPLVSADRSFGLRERVEHSGAVHTPLEHDDLEALVQALGGAGADSVAVSLLHAYANPTHELAVAAALAGHFRHVSLSHRVNPEAREYERTSSTVLNAATMPIAVEYIDELLQALPLEGRLQLFHSAGGWATPRDVRSRPLIMALSGPAAGVSASARMAEVLGRKNVLTFDMGGTTTDVCLVVDGQAHVTDSREIGDRPLRQPMVAVHSIGAGGGSIVRLTPGGLLVGPESAGAEPGPACYGAGGVEPTVTDANVVLGYMDPDQRLGGTITLQPELSERALQPIADALGLGLIETALGIIRVANANMARALRRVTVERGVDGRRSALLAFGGAGPMHAVGLAEAFGIDEVIVPALSSGFSAHGCVVSDMSYAQQRTVRLLSDPWEPSRFDAAIGEMMRELEAPFEAQGVAQRKVEHVALVRYEGQSDAVPVPFDLPLDTVRLGEDFTRVHESLYGYATSEPWILEGIRLTVSSPARIGFSQAPGDAVIDAGLTRDCWFDKSAPVKTRRMPRGAVSDDAAAASLPGPLIIEDEWSTTIVPPGWECRADRLGNLFITSTEANHER